MHLSKHYCLPLSVIQVGNTAMSSVTYALYLPYARTNVTTYIVPARICEEHFTDALQHYMLNMDFIPVSYCN